MVVARSDFLYYLQTIGQVLLHELPSFAQQKGAKSFCGLLGLKVLTYILLPLLNAGGVVVHSTVQKNEGARKK